MINKLFSETGLLDEITFTSGLNVILGKYSSDRKAMGVNGIGKSSLIRLISYAFLSDSAERVFAKEKYDFLRNNEHNIVLEFSIGDIRYVIKRYFSKKDSVYFGEHGKSIIEYTKSELKHILINKLFPFDTSDVFFQGNRFGTLMNFFIKDDLENQQRIDPLNFLPYKPGAVETSIYNFYLLNLPTKNIIRFETLTDEYDKTNDTIKKLEDKICQATGKTIEEFKTDRIKEEKNIHLLEKSLKEYKFLDQYKNIEDQLLDLTNKINLKLKDYHSFNERMKKIKGAFRFSKEIDSEQIANIYNEALATFGDIVKKTLDDMEKFKGEIIENRNKFLVSRELELQEKIDNILTEIANLEKIRSELYKKLEEKGALESLANTYELLVTARSNLDSNVYALKQIDDMQSDLSNQSVYISETKRDILNDLKQCESTINEIRSLFQKILENAIFLGEAFSKAYFDISRKPESQKNYLPFKIEVEIPKADALGQSRLKIVAYDLMVFLNNINHKRALPNFLIHDGVFHGISKKTTINILNYIFHCQLEDPSFQYIVTFNEDEIAIPSAKKTTYGKFDFNLSDYVVAEFEDVPGKMLFKKVFG